ncbi:MAG TPA: PKD domain-containing protein [Solirubrobacteraceae bacterium]|jgi:hypothetical protein|nr:PKD domain-containing protein [Solirubrobacteraceae bacterium]
MPTTGRRRSLTIAAAVLATLAAPAAAQAATYTVNAGDGPCGAPADLACGGLTEAAAAAAPNDVFNVSPGSAPYGSAEFTVGGVTIAGNPNFLVNGTLTFSGSGGVVSKLEKAIVGQPNGAAPAVVVSGTAGLEISDSGIASANGDGVTFSEGNANKIVRTVVGTSGVNTSAVKITSADLSSNTKKLVAESSLFTGGLASLSVITGASAPVTSAGSVAVTLRHVTAADSTHGLLLDSSHAAPLVGGPAGNITLDAIDSIIQNGTSKTVYPGLLGILTPIAPANTITDTYTRTLTSFDPAVVFANPAANNFRLRPGSPAIDVGGFTTGESATDFEGDARPGPASDQGFDEFVNAPPTAVIEVKTSPQRTGRPVAFDGTKSSDREGAIVRYHWEFGDGQSADTTTATTTHAYVGEGDTNATLTVVDAEGVSSAAVSAPLKLVDGVPPVIVVALPTPNQKIKLTTRKTTTKTVTVDGKKVKRKTTTTKRTKLGFAGTAKDKSGVKGVVIIVERLKRTVSAASTSAKSSAATTPTKRCAWLDPKKGIVLRSCAKPILILTKVAANGNWIYPLKSTLKLSPGLYRVTAAGQDGAGANGNSAPQKDAVHRFTLVK